MATDDITLALGIELDAKHFQKVYGKTFRDMERQAKNASKHGQMAVTKFAVKMYQNFKKMPKAIGDATDALDAYNKETQIGVKLQQAAKEAYHAQFMELKKLLDVQSTMSEEQAAQHKEQIANQLAVVKKYKEQLRAADDFYDSAKKGAEDLEDSIKDMEFEFSGKKLLESAKEAGKELAEPFSLLLSRDLLGSVKSASKLAGKGVGGILGGIGKGVGGLGKAATAKGTKMEASGNTGTGGAMKDVGAFLSKIGPAIEMFAKIGPMIGLVGSAVVGLVKMFIDADAMVKEFNKDMLASAGTGQWFGKSMGSAGLGIANMESTLKGFRDAAYDAKENLNWGISASTHKEVLANLQAEGVQLTTLEKSYGQLNEKSASFAKSQASITQAAVAYSRSMGVSLQEVTSFQAEMMTEMGKSLGDTVTSFRQMAAGAEESGISANKFFHMIRGVSSDLDVYNTRLQTAVMLLGKLGKVMSPKNAQKFMQMAMNAYKGMSFQDRVKNSLLAERAKPGITGKIVDEDIASKNEGLAKDISAAGGGTYDEVFKALKDGNKEAVKGFIQAADKSQQGTLTQGVSRLNREKKEAAGGALGKAKALKRVNMVGALEHKFTATQGVTKEGSNFEELGAQLAGMSPEEYDLTLDMKSAIDDQRDIAFKQLQKEGKLEKGAKAADLTWQQIYDTMDQTQKDAADGKDAQEEANKRMGTNVQSVTEKLQVLVDFFINKFYNLMLDFYGIILDMAAAAHIGGAKEKKEKLELEKFAQGSKSDLIKNAVGESGGDKWKFRDAAIKGVADKAWGAEKAIGALKEERKTAKGANLEKIDANIGALQNALAGSFKSIDKNLTMQGRLETVGKMSNKDLAKKITAELEDVVASGSGEQLSIEDAMKRAGVSEQVSNKDLAELSSQGGWNMDPSMKDPRVVAQSMKSAGDAFDKSLEGTNLKEMVSKATTEGSIYTHDTHLEDLRKESDSKDPTTAIKKMLLEGGVPEAGIGGGLDPTLQEDQAEAQEVTVGTLAEIVDVLKTKGIKLNRTWMDNYMKSMFEEATLDAARVALLEYFMYKDMKQADVAKVLASGVAPKDFGKGVLAQGQDKKTGDEALKNMILAPNAMGGVVTGVSNGLATIRAAAGEGLASVGTGERIVPGGGGGGTKIELSLKGDLMALIEAKAQDVVVKHAAAAKNR